MSGHWATWLGLGIVLASADVELGLVKPRPEKRDAGNSSESPNSSDKRPDASDGLGNPASQDIGALVGAALEAAKPAIPQLTVHVADFPCPPCEQLKRTLAGMGELVSVSYQLGGEAQYPALKYAGRTWYGALSAGQIEAILREYKPPVIPQAVSVGKLAIRSTVRDILQRVDSSGNIQVGSATILLPPTMQPQVKLSRQALVVTFSGQKPRLKYGAKWLALGADINGLTISESLLTVSVAGLPDVSLVVE